METESSGNPCAHRPTMEDLSRELGLSISTISRSLQNHRSISPATRAKVQALARQRGYTPNPYISALMSSLKGRRPAPYHATLAILDTLEHVDDWKKHAVQQQFDQGIRIRASELGYTVERHWVENTAQGAHLNRVLRARGILGVLMTPQANQSIHIPSLLDWQHVACVTVGFRMLEPPFLFCTNDQLASSFTAFTRLYESGYRRIGLLTSDFLEYVVDNKYSLGFRHAAEKLGHRLPASFVFQFHNEEEKQKTPARLVSWLKSYRPDALCGVQPDLVRVRQLPKKQNPTQPLLASLDMEQDHGDQPGILQNSHQVGASAVDLLVQQLQRGAFGIPESTYGMIIEGTWNSGRTHPAPKVFTKHSNTPKSTQRVAN